MTKPLTAPKHNMDLPPVLSGFSQINRYWDPQLQSCAAKILPGQYYVTLHDEVIVTVLGSCVSACIRDRVFGIGGMNHFMLPGEGRFPVAQDSGQILDEAARYGAYAMELLINEILKNGGRRQNLEVKITGGGRMLVHLSDVGQRNIEFVRQFLKTEGLVVAAEDLGDIYPRKVYYFPVTGKVRVKKLRSMHNDTIAQREDAYLQDLQKQSPQGEVELF